MDNKKIVVLDAVKKRTKYAIIGALLLTFYWGNIHIRANCSDTPFTVDTGKNITVAVGAFPITDKMVYSNNIINTCVSYLFMGALNTKNIELVSAEKVFAASALTCK